MSEKIDRKSFLEVMDRIVMQTCAIEELIKDQPATIRADARNNVLEALNHLSIAHERLAEQLEEEDND